MARGSKILKKAIKRLRASGLTWQEVADYYGGSRASAYVIATGKWEPSEERAREIIATLPRRVFWEGCDDLDALVFGLLKTGARITGAKIAKLLGTNDRTIRASIKRLRKKYNIDASMKPPRGYLLKAGIDGQAGIG